MILGVCLNLLGWRSKPKSPRPKPERPEIVDGYEFLVDSREKATVKNRVAAHGIQFRETALDADFVLRMLRPEVKDIAGFERKAVADLVQSIGQRYKTKGHYQPRLFEQARRMSKLFDTSFLVISGDLDKHKEQLFFKTRGRFKIHDNVIWGSLASLAIRYNIQVAWLPDDDALIEFVHRACVKISEGKLNMAKEVPKYTRFSAQGMLAMFPGITSKIAERMLKKLGSLRSVATAKTEELEKVDGIGPVTADTVNKFFRKKH